PEGTAREVADEFELNTSDSSNTLDRLVEGGYLVADTAKEGREPVAGRPSKHYRATTKDVSLSYPARHDDLLAMLLAKALESLEPEQASALAEKVGYDYGRAVAADLRPSGNPTSFRR